MSQIAQKGKDMLRIVEKYEVPYEYHNALWAAYEAGAEMGFFKAITPVSDLANNSLSANTDASNPPICQCSIPTQGKQMEWGDQYCSACGGLV